jgi:hypothetical protein
MKPIAIITIIAAIALAHSLTSCAGFSITATTPYGDVQSIDGATVIIPKPVVIPSRK